MEVSWFLLLVSAAVLAAIFLLLVVCVDCSNQDPMAHIRQGSASEEDVSNSGFVIIHPRSTLPFLGGNPAHPSSVMLSPYPNADEVGLRPTTPTETESNPSYENSGTPPGRPESDPEETGYIIVLPENDPEKSRASMPCSDGQNSSSSSSDNLHEYVNVESPGSGNYLNVVPSPNNARSTPEPSCQSFSDDDDDDDDDSNYVNQPPIHHS